jgi:hypothetical protein
MGDPKVPCFQQFTSGKFFFLFVILLKSLGIYMGGHELHNVPMQHRAPKDMSKVRTNTGGPRPPRGKNLFKQSDLMRSIRSALAAGLPVAGIQVHPGGGFSLVIGGADAVSDGASGNQSEVERWLSKHNAHQR